MCCAQWAASGFVPKMRKKRTPQPKLARIWLRFIYVGSSRKHEGLIPVAWNLLWGLGLHEHPRTSDVPPCSGACCLSLPKAFRFPLKETTLLQSILSWPSRLAQVASHFCCYQSWPKGSETSTSLQTPRTEDVCFKTRHRLLWSFRQDSFCHWVSIRYSQLAPGMLWSWSLDYEHVPDVVGGPDGSSHALGPPLPSPKKTYTSSFKTIRWDQY